MKLFVTGGAGFIGSCFVRRRVAAGDDVTVLDKLTYAGHMESLAGIESEIDFVEGDICDGAAVDRIMESRFDVLVNFAAESHVDRSINSAAEFVRTNVDGTRVLLEAAMRNECGLFCQIGTDEVYGSAAPDEVFTEESRLRPSSPYSASKAAADLIASSFHRTHGLPVVITRCTNNYGPRQHPEKFIPLFVIRAIAGEELPLYGDGLNERDWLHVEDHCAAVDRVIADGVPGEIYNVSAGDPVKNRDVVDSILKELGASESLVRLVEDRPAHDRRYAIDSSKIRGELGWSPEKSFPEGLQQTIAWYRNNADWVRAVTGPEFEDHCRKLYQNRPKAGE